MAAPIELGLPVPFRKIIQQILDFSDSQFDLLKNSLEVSDPTATSEQLIGDLVAADETFEANDLERLLAFVVSTRSMASSLATDELGVATAISRAFYRDEADPENTVLSDRLVPLLASRFVSIREKAQGLTADAHPKVESVRVLADLRPVFSIDGSPDAIIGFIILMTLALDVEFVNKPNEMLQFRLSSTELRKLQDVIKRAIDKTEYLEKMLGDMSLLDLTEVAGA